ncbi:DUF6759 domain-containing protein [Elizabethkingia sp. JS20170427COW]|uniref:DUF6759 domain-containing protein n=1 Tax=Elizabethkingia sp. JS20170427COW TaxID=2583851 RepID=UPI001110B2BA|nr:DUF6759 domain-containing protein [Elizabethkingia sp. JS20170427COW]QCX53354.1 hypothetical protein FGE20_06195 [Elizabethkingia sp. JS20170427COW]
MKKIILLIGGLGMLQSCFTYSYPSASSFPSTRYPSSNSNQKYDELVKTYKPDTEEVLNDLLGSSSADNPRTSLVVKNNSRCNIVLTISTVNFVKKVPIAAGETGYSILNKNNYNLSAMVCGRVFKQRISLYSSQQLDLR